MWKLLYVNGQEAAPPPNATPAVARGAYLVLGPGHCSECHSPRNVIGGIVASRAFSGGPSPVGGGFIPNITPDDETGIGHWAVDVIAQSFKDGFKPSHDGGMSIDSYGAEMAAVQRNLAQLSDDDRTAIAAFLKTLPPIKSAKPTQKAPAAGS
jgi:mono/diheme cytochrome c family protein